MTKKKDSDQSAVSSDQSTEYEVGVWSGQPHYKCKLCAFDTLVGPVAMLTHLVGAHNSEAALEKLIALEPPKEKKVLLKEVPPAAVIELTEEDVNDLLKHSEEGDPNA